MISVSDFRTGNLVLNDGDVVTVDVTHLAHMTKHPEEYTGIPLDGQWLKKLGLLMASGYKWRRIVRDGKTDKPFSLRQCAGGYELSFRYTCYIGVPLQYVHQLQNLFYALTGTELTMKP